MQRIEEYNQLLEDSKEVLRKDTTLWKGFLKFATQFTHYQFFDQILIYVQNPKATACATFDQWKKIGRYVRKGEHSIVLLDETGKRGKLRHIFDVTATGPDQEFEYRPKPILPEQREELARKLNAAYSTEAGSRYQQALSCLFSRLCKMVNIKKRMEQFVRKNRIIKNC